MSGEEFTGLGDNAISQQRDPQESPLFCEFTNMFDQAAAETLAAMIGMDNAVF